MGPTEAKPLPDVAVLNLLFSYDRSSGVLFWRSGPRSGKAAGYETAKGYRQIRIDGRLVLAHRIVWKLETGEEPKQIDHKSVNARDNRFANLRASENQSNNCNKPLTKSNKSGFKGVYWHRTAGKWCATITCDYKKKHLGLFVDAAEAYQAYLAAARQMHGEFHHAGVLA